MQIVKKFFSKLFGGKPEKANAEVPVDNGDLEEIAESEIVVSEEPLGLVYKGKPLEDSSETIRLSNNPKKQDERLALRSVKRGNTVFIRTRSGRLKRARVVRWKNGKPMGLRTHRGAPVLPMSRAVIRVAA